MKGLVNYISENIQANIPVTVLDKKSLKTFANNVKELKFKGAEPSFLAYKVKDGIPYIFFATEMGMQEFLNTTLEENGKQISQRVIRLKYGESIQTEDKIIWTRIAK